MLRALRSLPGVKKVFIRSGIRFDYMLADQSGGFLRELCEHHISGTLKVAPEHISDNVLKRMHKPDRSVFERFCRKYEAENKRIGKKQYMIPYFISSHPGATLEAVSYTHLSFQYSDCIGSGIFLLLNRRADSCGSPEQIRGLVQKKGRGRR